MHENIIDVADWVADRFTENGIDRIFVYSGGTIAPLVKTCIRKNIVIEKFEDSMSNLKIGIKK